MVVAVRVRGQIISLISGNFARARKITGFGVSFLAAKIAIYAIPLIIARFAAPDLYGALEFAQSVSLFASGIATGPFLFGLNHLHLTRYGDRLGPEIVAVLWACVAISAVGLMIAQLSDWPAQWRVAISLFALAGAQNTISTAFRAYGWRHATAWSDGMATLLMGVALLIATAFSGSRRVAALTYSILALGLAVAVVAQWRCRARPWRETWTRIVAAVPVGWPITLLGMFAIWISTSGRILVGLVSPEAIPVYAVTFRIVGFALGVHQLASTAFFRQLYVARTRQADRSFQMILMLVGVVTLGLMILAPILTTRIRFRALEGHPRSEFLQVLASMGVFFFAWSAYNWLQLRLNRLQMSRRAAVPMTVISALGAVFLVYDRTLFAGHIGLFCWLLAGQVVAYFCTAWLMLARVGLPHVRTGLTGLGGILVLAATGIAIQFYA